MRKLVFLNYLKHLDKKALARQILDEQSSLNWPGLASEARQLCLRLGLEDISTTEVEVNVWKKKVKTAAKRFNCANPK